MEPLRFWNREGGTLEASEGEGLSAARLPRLPSFVGDAIEGGGGHGYGIGWERSESEMIRD